MIVDRPGYFGKQRPEKEAQYNTTYGAGQWHEMWEVEGEIASFSEAVKHYDYSYFLYLFYHPALQDFVSHYDECYDSDVSNIDCGYEHDPLSVPRHIQDVSVRRAMRDLEKPFRGVGIPSKSQYLRKLLHIRGPETNGFILSPMMVTFYDKRLILPKDKGGPLPDWCKKEDSVEAFWQRSKVIVI